MLALKILLITVETICSFLLIVMILLQKAKGEGLGLAFGAEMGESIFGARASNVLVKATMWVGAVFILNTVLLATIYSQAPGNSILGGRTRAPIEQPVRPVQAPSPASMPASVPASLSAAPALPAPEAQPQAPVSAPQTPAAP